MYYLAYSYLKLREKWNSTVLFLCFLVWKARKVMASLIRTALLFRIVFPHTFRRPIFHEVFLESAVFWGHEFSTIQIRNQKDEYYCVSFSIAYSLFWFIFNKRKVRNKHIGWLQYFFGRLPTFLKYHFAVFFHRQTFWYPT